MNPAPPVFKRPYSGKPAPGVLELRDCVLCGFHRYRDESRFYCVGWQESLSMDSRRRRCHFFTFGQPNADQVQEVQRICRPISGLAELVPVTEWEKAECISRVLRERDHAKAAKSAAVLNLKDTTALVTSGVKSQFETFCPENCPSPRAGFSF